MLSLWLQGIWNLRILQEKKTLPENAGYWFFLQKSQPSNPHQITRKASYCLTKLFPMKYTGKTFLSVNICLSRRAIYVCIQLHICIFFPWTLFIRQGINFIFSCLISYEAVTTSIQYMYTTFISAIYCSFHNLFWHSKLAI